jgi:transcriptional regulator with XRE-family HTH domain
MGNRLKELRNKRGWTQQQAADAFNMSRGGYIKIEDGERRLELKRIRQAAEIYGISEAEVVSARSNVPLIGYVGAGSEMHYYGNGDPLHDEAAMPPGGNENTVAVEVRGDSLGAIFNRWLVYYDRVHTPPTPDMLRRLCVVGLQDDRVLVKLLLPGTRPGRFHLVSQTEGIIEDAQVKWAAVVRAIMPK